MPAFPRFFQILVIEGLHPFFDKRVAQLVDFKIYLDISDDIKFAWKIQVRDNLRVSLLLTCASGRRCNMLCCRATCVTLDLRTARHG